MAIIEVENLVKRYGGHTAVDGVSFAVEQGEIFGILGPNGAGKTTTVECIEGLRTPDGGAIRVCGIDPQRDTGELRQLLGAQLQESELPDKLKVGEAMELYSSFYRDPADWRELVGDAQPHRQARHPVPAAVRRAEAAAVDRARADRQPEGGGARRAHHRARPAGPARRVGPDRGHPRPRRDDRAGHALHGGGGAALRPARRDRRRPARRARHAPPGWSRRSTTGSGSGSGRPRRSTTRCWPRCPRSPRSSGPASQLVVTGTGNLLLAVTTVLARNQVVAADLRVEQTSLDDAFVALTGRTIDN